MHLGFSVPNIWYMADLSAPGYHAAGVTLTGMPFVIAGHNEHVAWGFTALYGDVQDLYVENLDGKGNSSPPMEAGSRSPWITRSSMSAAEKTSRSTCNRRIMVRC